ncbi:MAG: hypothetical protein KDA67_07000 [Rhodobacteraceae bacterium]|nr:hypothetical protein [Paracoccaceae bacterium]
MRVDTSLLLGLPATIVAVELVLVLRFRSVLSRWGRVMAQSTALMQDKNLSDSDKQSRLAKASGATLSESLKLLAIILVALFGYAMVIGAGVELFRLDTSMPQVLTRVDLQILSVIVAIVWIWIRTRVFG